MFSGVNLSANGLQQVISAATADNNLVSVIPHHPITCDSKLYFNDDNTFSCEHVTVPDDDKRTQMAIIHSIANLIIEEAVRKFR